MRGLRSSASERVTPDDEALMIRIARGDSQALELLYDRYARTVYGTALRILRNPELAEDIVQETFWRVWRRSSTFESGRGQVASWVFGIARHLSIDELRRQRSRPQQVSDQPDRSVLRDRVDSQMDVATRALEAEQRQVITSALSLLPDEQREVIELAYFGGLSQREIADGLQRPIGTIKTRVRLGLQKLRDILRTARFDPRDVDA